MQQWPPSSSPVQAHQVREQFATEENYLSYELGKAVQDLPPVYVRLLTGGISILLLCILGWAHFSKIDEVVSASGQLITPEKIRPIRSLGVGKIGVVHVKTGDQVQKGEVLLKQDPTLTRAEISRLEKSVQLIQDEMIRLEAERSGSTVSGVPLQDQLFTARLQDFEARQAAASAEANRQLAAINEAKIRLEGLRTNLVNSQQRLNTAYERDERMSGVESSGAISRFDYLSIRDNLIEAQDRVVSLESSIVAQNEIIQQAEESYQAAKNSVERLGAERQTEILSRLQQRGEELVNIEGQLEQAKRQQSLEVVTAPVTGTIYEVKASIGPVQSGEELLSILPDGETIKLEAQVLNQDVGFIQEGMPVKVKVNTFSFQEFGTIDGTVTKISPNSVMEQNVGLVFPVEIELAQFHMNIYGEQVSLTPGLAATGEIITRRKSILMAVIEPVTKNFSKALRER